MISSSRNTRGAFISYASEEREIVVRPLASQLEALGLTVWWDQGDISLSDDAIQAINVGLRTTDYGIVIVSKAFLKKLVPRAELSALLFREIQGRSVTIPVWVDVDEGYLADEYPLIGTRWAARWSEGVESVARQIVEFIQTRTRIANDSNEHKQENHTTVLRNEPVERHYTPPNATSRIGIIDLVYDEMAPSSVDLEHQLTQEIDAKSTPGEIEILASGWLRSGEDEKLIQLPDGSTHLVFWPFSGKAVSMHTYSGLPSIALRATDFSAELRIHKTAPGINPAKSWAVLSICFVCSRSFEEVKEIVQALHNKWQIPGLEMIAYIFEGELGDRSTWRQRKADESGYITWRFPV